MNDHSHSRWRHMIDWPYWALDLGVYVGLGLMLASFLIIVWSAS